MVRENKYKEEVLIGVDFDGVVTQNPLRAARVLIATIKHKILKIKRLSFFVPRNRWQRIVYYIGVIAPSFWPAEGTEALKEMSKLKKYQFVLVTGRYGFVEKQTNKWLEKHGLSRCFRTVFINKSQEQPHEFKRRIILEEKFDYYIEDNWDIVNRLSPSVKTKIYWISNFLDQKRSYVYKFPSLSRALESIRSENESIS